jgi:hypothetical protein
MIWSRRRQRFAVTLLSATVIAGTFLLRAVPARATLVNCKGLPSGVTETEVNATWIRLQLEIPGITPVCDEPDQDNTGVVKKIPVIQDMGAYVGGLYKYLVSVIGILAAVMVFYGGLRWLTAGGNASRVKDAKETVFSALIAIVIAFGSYLLLFTINPKLVQMRPPTLKVADTIFQQNDVACNTQKICFSGTSIGKVCKVDGDCPGGGSGSCQGMVDVTPGMNLTCGTRYNYKKYKNTTTSVSTSETCVGAYCSSSIDVCGKASDLLSGVIEGATCQLPDSLCESLIDDMGATKNDCSKVSLPEYGKCAWDEPTIDDDQCFWYPRVLCSDAGATQVGCGECNTANAASSITAISYNSIGQGVFTDPQKLSCEANSSDYVYAKEKTQDGKYKALCCKNTSGKLMYVTNSTQTIKSGPDYP